ncbi:hypothetical protein ACN23B_02415 [Anabaena sp. FACHB-709]|uniref:Uncharacterized protein n=1 Tax=Trichormus variabilis NIES-23 TaxID=1973479 RepID=A0A1Z4KR22_ANAVA|nr:MULTISPECIES: hypothetical protein [Nostocaceae]BAY71455.1 hypothetical protein NIES23_42730 [Trichormus variabilis NIES-23]
MLREEVGEQCGILYERLRQGLCPSGAIAQEQGDKKIIDNAENP